MIPIGHIKATDIEGLDREAILDALETDADRAYAEVEGRFGPETKETVLPAPGLVG